MMKNLVTQMEMFIPDLMALERRRKVRRCMTQFLTAAFLGAGLIGALSLTTPASANAIDDCRIAVEGGDKELANIASGKLLANGGTVIPHEALESVTACMELGRGSRVAYSHQYKVFKIAGQARIENEKWVERIVAEDMAKNRRLKELAVQLHLSDACIRLYRSDPDEAILNRMCYDVFIDIGLPD